MKNNFDILKIFSVLGRNYLFYFSRLFNYPLVTPDTLQLNINFNCNLNCVMCHMDKKKKLVKKELGLEELKKVVFEGKEMGIKNVLILGGEPFLWKDLFKLIEFCNKEGMDTTVITNGTLLNKSLLGKIFSSRLPHLHLSLDGATSKTHNAIRGKNVFEKVMKNISLLNEYKKNTDSSFPTLGITFTIMKHNLREVPLMIDLAKEMKVNSLNFQPVVVDNTEPRLRGVNSSVWIDKKDFPNLDSSIEKLVALKKKSKENYDLIENTFSNLKLIKKYFKGQIKANSRPCYAGFNRLHVTQIGTGYLCDLSFGDIRKQSLKEIWFSQQAGEMRKKIKNCKTPCMQFCAYRPDFDAVENEVGKIFL